MYFPQGVLLVSRPDIIKIEITNANKTNVYNLYQKDVTHGIIVVVDIPRQK